MNRTEMRRCGRRYETKAEALRSKPYLAGGRAAETCPDPVCGGVHLRKVTAPAASATPVARPSGAHPFPAAVAALIDARDVDLLTGERCCQSCGSTENLERHHRRLKGMGGSEDRDHSQCACNGVTLCMREHRGRKGVHRAGRRQAEAVGFIVSQSVDEPNRVAVMRFAEANGGASQWPTCDGRWVDKAPAEGSGASLPSRWRAGFGHGPASHAHRHRDRAAALRAMPHPRKPAPSRRHPPVLHLPGRAGHRVPDQGSREAPCREGCGDSPRGDLNA